MKLEEKHFGRGIDWEYYEDDYFDRHYDELVGSYKAYHLEDDIEMYKDEYNNFETQEDYDDFNNDNHTDIESLEDLENYILNPSYLKDLYREEIHEGALEELQELWDKAYKQLEKDCNKLVDNINKDLKFDIKLKYSINESRSWATGDFPSNYVEFTIDTPWDLDEEGILTKYDYDDLDNFSCELRFSDGHDNGRFYGVEIEWQDYQENTSYYETLYYLLSDNLSMDIDEELLDKIGLNI